MDIMLRHTLISYKPFRSFVACTMLMVLIRPKAHSMERPSALSNALLITFLAGAGLTLYYKLCLTQSAPSNQEKEPDVKYELSYIHPLFTTIPCENTLATSIVSAYLKREHIIAYYLRYNFPQKRKQTINICLSLDAKDNNGEEFSITVSKDICAQSQLLKNMLSDIVVEKDIKLIPLQGINKAELCCLGNLLTLCDQLEQVKNNGSEDTYNAIERAFNESCSALSFYEMAGIIKLYDKYDIKYLENVLAGSLARCISTCKDLYILLAEPQLLKSVEDILKQGRNNEEIHKHFFCAMPINAGCINFTIDTFEKQISFKLDLPVGSLEPNTLLTNPVYQKLDVRRNSDYSLTILNTDTQLEVAKLKGHTGPIIYWVWSADGMRLLTVSKDNTARLWDWQNKKVLAVIDNLNFPCSAVMRHEGITNPKVKVDYDLVSAYYGSFSNQGKLGLNAIFHSSGKLVIALVNQNNKVEYVVLNAMTGKTILINSFPSSISPLSGIFGSCLYNRFLVCHDNKIVIYTDCISTERYVYDESQPSFEILHMKNILTPVQALYCLSVESLSQLNKVANSRYKQLDLKRSDYLTNVHSSLPVEIKKNLTRAYQADLDKIIKPS